MTANAWSEVERLRLENFNAMFERLCSESPFYRKKFEALKGLRFGSLSEITALPGTQKKELQTSGASYLRDGQRPTAYFESSGTTGAPLVGYPDLSFEKAAAFGTFLDGWLGLRTAHVDRAVVALGYEMSPVGIRFQQALQTLGISVIPLGVRSTMCPPLRSIDIILRTGPQAIFCRPWELLRYGDIIQDMAPEALDMQKVFFLGEVMSESKRARISHLWNGADVHGHYGLTELDTGLQTCDLGNYHEPETPFLHVELISSDGQAITRNDHMGQLVISTLRDTSAPLLRYHTGDAAQRVACPCGQRSPAYRIFGRLIDQAVIGGTSIFPCELEQRVLAVASVGSELHLVLEHDGGLTLRVEKERDFPQTDSELEKAVRSALPGDIERHTNVDVFDYGKLADKLGIAKRKSGQFIDLRHAQGRDRAAMLAVNIIDSDSLAELSPCTYVRSAAGHTAA